jgi:hypothetical protein
VTSWTPRGSGRSRPPASFGARRKGRGTSCPVPTYGGKFYALPQSPQLFKQMLQVSGVEKYFQIAAASATRDARRPPGGVLADRPRDVVRHAGRRVRHRRAAHGAAVEGRLGVICPRRSRG